MKKVCNCLLLALLIQVVASCGNLNMTGPSKDYSDSSIKTLTITTGASIAGSIVPSALDRSSLKYYFEIDNLDLRTDSKTLKVFDPDGGGTTLNFPIELKDGYYRISVYALKASAAANFAVNNYLKPSSEGGFNASQLEAACVLSGFTIVDLRQDETVSVYLSADRLTQKGSVALKFYTKGWTIDSGKFEAACEMVNASGSRVGDLRPLTNLLTNTPPDPSSHYMYQESNVPAGTYTLRVNYTKVSDPSVVYTWADTIFVLANQSIEMTIALPDIIDHAPKAPTNFKASYNDYDSNSIYCYVNFTWTDNSVNEKGFQVELFPIEPIYDDALITSDMAESWLSAREAAGAVSGSFVTVGNGSTTQTFDGGVYWVDGSLAKNSGSATFKISRNYRYFARISAVGSGHAGLSDYCYLDLSAGGTGKSGYRPFDTSARYIKVGD